MAAGRVGSGTTGPVRTDGSRGDRWLRRFGWFTNRSVRLKIVAAVLVVGSAGGLVGLSSLARFDELRGRVDSMQRHGVLPVSELATVRQAVLQTRVDALADEYLGTPAEHQAYLNDLANVDRTFGRYCSDNDADGPLAGYRQQFQTAWDRYRTVVSGPLLALARAGNMNAYIALRDSAVKPAAVAFNDALTKMENVESATAKAEVAKATGTVRSGRIEIITMMVTGSVLALLAGLAVAQLVVTPVRRVSRVLSGLADGDLTGTVDVPTTDEIGRMAGAVGTATGGLRDMVVAVSGNARDLAGASDELSGISAAITSSTGDVSAEAEVVSAAAEQVAANVRTVAAGAGEMSASIQEIASSATEAARVAHDAVRLATEANSTVGRLDESSSRIGAVVKMITTIAGQTNLLALNATIEAARAGDAGRGFAVVAGEVKDLAQETAKATDDIARLVEVIQADTRAAVSAIGEVGDVIGNISSLQETISAAVEQQTATTSEMGRNATEAASGVANIAGNITRVAGAAEVSMERVGEATAAVRRLAEMAVELRDRVGRFEVGTTGTALDDPIGRAIEAHAAWKTRLLTAIETGASDIDVDRAALDDKCEFGQWLYQSATQNERADPHYQQCRALHTDFHRAAAAVLRLALAGRRAEAEAAMTPVSEFGRVCQELTGTLADWKRLARR